MMALSRSLSSGVDTSLWCCVMWAAACSTIPRFVLELNMASQSKPASRHASTLSFRPNQRIPKATSHVSHADHRLSFSNERLDQGRHLSGPREEKPVASA